MRLLLVIRETFPTFRADVADLFGTWLPRLGVASTLVASPAADPGRAPAAWGGGEVLLHRPRSSRATRVLCSLVHDLVCVARRGRGHDAVIVRDKILSAALILPLARLLGAPLFYWMSFPYPDDDLVRARLHGPSLGPARWLYTLLRGICTRWLLYRWVLPRCDHAFVQSERMRDDLVGLGLAAKKLTPAPMGVDLERLEAARQSVSRKAAPDGAGSLVYLGALDAVRRPEFLLEVLAVVRRRRPGATLRLVGDAPDPADRRRMEALIREAGLEGAVSITGWLRQEEAWRMARESDVGVCSLPPEPVLLSMSPTKAVELMALEAPVVVTEHPDQGRVVREAGAGRCVAYDPGAMAEAVLDLLEDPDAARAMGRRGRAYVEAHRSYAVLARDLAVRLADLAGRRRGARPGVLIVSSSVRVMGGISSVVRTYLESDLARDFDLQTVASHRDGARPYKLLVAFLALLAAAWRLAFGRVDIAHIHSGDFYSPHRKYLFYCLARLFRKKILLHIHGGGMLEQIRDARGFWKERLLGMLAGADRVVCLSQWGARELLRLVPGARFAVVPNGVELPALAGREDGEGPGPVRFTLLGRDARRKGLFDLLPAFARVVRAGADVQLHIAGCDRTRTLLDAIASLGLAGRVRVWGWVSGAARERLWAETDVLALPSHRECLPMSLLEAMARGLPVLATPVGGVPEMVEDERSGLLVPVGDIPALSCGLERLAADAELRRRCGREGRRIVAERYSLARTAALLAGLYREVLAETRGRTPGREG